MSRMKSIFLVLLLTGIVSIVPMAQAATTVETTIAGSSAMWQTLALGAFNEAGSGAGHWTSASNVVNLTDSRVTPVNNDAGTIWIVWNSTATKVWSFNKVDSVVGDRCYFAQPQCSVNGTLANLSGSGSQQISSVLWGADSTLPANVQSLFVTGTPVNVAATDIRPEDANFAACRVNSALGAGPGFPSGASDGLDGLGYNPNNQPGVCPVAGLSQANYLGTPIKSGYPGAATTDAANVLAFNIKGKDPISGTNIPAFTVEEVGVEPIVFIFERANGQLGDLQNASVEQLDKVFSGKNCDASELDSPDGDPLAPAGINVFLREPLSGTYNVTESNVMRRPVVYPGGFLAYSMETGVNGAVNNPLAGQAGTCNSTDGKGARYRAIGTGEEVKSVLTSSSKFPNSIDGIGFAFFSYGNVSTIANSSSYGYITLDNIDPIFASYGPQASTGAGFDPGQPAGAGVIPGAANLPASCSGAFPCPENEIWAGGLSFPNVRNGTYAAWSLLRLVSNGSGLTATKALVKASQAFVVDAVPDYIPATKTVGKTQTDPGLLLVRSHYQQYDGNGNNLGDSGVNCGTGEAGGDMGGIVLPFIAAKTCPTTPTQQVQGKQGLQVRPVAP
jgi:hypothetical protein